MTFMIRGAPTVMTVSPDLVGPSITRNSVIIGEGVDMSTRVSAVQWGQCEMPR